MSSKPGIAGVGFIASEPLPVVARSSHVHRAPVLCVGNDPPLLSYRAEVLKIAGFEVSSICLGPKQQPSLPELERTPVICVICHTLSFEQRAAVAQQLRGAYPSSKLLALSAGDVSPEEATSYDAVVDSLEGPAALIHLLQAQL